MLAAFGAEVRTGAPVFVQIQQTPLFIGLAFATIIIASVIPVARKANLDRDGFGPFTQVCCQAPLVVMLLPSDAFARILLLLSPALICFTLYNQRLQLADHLHGWWRRKQRCTTAGLRWLPLRCSSCAPQVVAVILSCLKLRSFARRLSCLASTEQIVRHNASHVWLETTQVCLKPSRLLAGGGDLEGGPGSQVLVSAVPPDAPAARCVCGKRDAQPV